MATDHHALVFGASGISGWAVVNALLNDYPSPDAFRRITAFTNRPLPLETTLWPASGKLLLLSGLDLIKTDQEALENKLRQQVPDIASITIVYFFAYVNDSNPDGEVEDNVDILKKTITAVEKLSPNLKFVVLPTGAKYYGIHLPGHFPKKEKLPLKESLPRLPEPFASLLFYYMQLDLLQNLSEGKSWSYCDVRADVIVGFVPNNNVYCIAQWLAIYLSLYREIHGEGARVAFPGTMEAWTILSNEANQDTIARFAIYASLHPETSAKQGFNIADGAQPTTWSAKWPIICEYFGLKGVAPTDGPGPNPTEFISQHAREWIEMEAKYGLRRGHAINERSSKFFPSAVMYYMDFDRQLDMEKTYQAWGDAKEEMNVKQSWYTTFDRFRQAKIIP